MKAQRAAGSGSDAPSPAEGAELRSVRRRETFALPSRQPGPGTGMPGAGREAAASGSRCCQESGAKGAPGQPRCPQVPGAGVEACGGGGAVPGS